MSDIVERIAARLKAASINDRAYERPMSWDEADQIVAILTAKVQNHGDCYTLQQLSDMEGTSKPVRAAMQDMAAEITSLQAELAEARDKALDEAAEVAEDHTRNYSPGTFKGLRENITQAIRALKSTKPPIL